MIIKGNLSDQNNITYATFWQRLLAHNIDLLPILGVFYLTTFLPNTDVDFIMLGIIYVIYHSLFEMSRWKATPGKKWVKIKVMDAKQNEIHPFRILLRNAGKSFSLILFFLGFVMIIFHPKKQGLHDYIAGTMVLFDED